MREAYHAELGDRRPRARSPELGSRARARPTLGAAASLREGMAETFDHSPARRTPDPGPHAAQRPIPIESHDRDLSGAFQATSSGGATGQWRCAGARHGMLEADHQFRRVNGHLQLPKLRAALEARFTEDVVPVCHDQNMNAA